MRTIALVAVLAAVVLAGCVGGVGDGPSGTEAPATTSGTAQSPETGTATPYPDRTVVFPAGPKSAPERPDELTAETAASFVERYEFRYSYNDLWAGPGTDVGMSERSCGVESVESRDTGYVVTVRCSAYVNEPVAGENATRTRHYDYPPWTARYYVDEDSLRREEVE